MFKSYKPLQILILTAAMASSAIYAVDTNFVLKNGSNVGPIQIDVMQNGKSVSGGLRSIAKGSEYFLNIPITSPTTMELNYCATASSCKTELPEKLIVKFPANKTMYIKFDGKQIEPQKGDLLGRTTGENSGLSTKNNVTKNDISITRGQTTHADLGGGKTIPHKPTGSIDIEKEAWKHFPITEGDLITTKDILPNEFWIKVLGLDYYYIISLPYNQSYDTIEQKIKSNYAAKLTELSKIQNADVRAKAKEFAKTAFEKDTAFVKKFAASRSAAVKPQKQEPMVTGVGKTGPIMPEGPISSPASSTPHAEKPAKPTAPKPQPTESINREETTKTPLEIAWEIFPAANKLRKEDNITITYNSEQERRDAVRLARLVFEVKGSTPKAEILKKYKQLSLKYHPDKYAGDKEVAAAISSILSNARDVLMSSSDSDSTPNNTGKQQLIKLFDRYPTGYKAFADPILERLTSTSEYNKSLLLEIQNKVKNNQTLPISWKNEVLTAIDNELKNM